MELEVASPKARCLSPFDSPIDKEFSDDDDDRNHKHRRQDTQSQSSDRDAMEQVFSRPFRKRGNPYENGHSFPGSDSQSGEGSKKINIAPSEKRRPGFSSFSRPALDFNKRNKGPQSFSGNSAAGRGRGRDLWSHSDSRFSSVDATYQGVHQGSYHPGLFLGNGFPNASNASWNSFGLIPGLPNGGVDAFHSLGLQGSLRQPIYPPLNMGIPRQRCRDFEERGFCLRGDMCPMEHGFNRIVVEDVQSLSQFNLPASLPSAHLMGTPSGPASTPSVNAPSSTTMNNKGLSSKSSKSDFMGDTLGLESPFPGHGATETDFYDPDQPLWNTDRLEASSSLLAPNSSMIDNSDTLIDGNTTVDSQGTDLPIWRRIGSSNSRSEVKVESNSSANLKGQLAGDMKDDQEVLTDDHTVHQRKQTAREHIAFKSTEISNKTQNDHLPHVRKPSQKAHRTLLVIGIPQKNNRREALLLHFQKFGDVIDIYIPLNSDRAFVQFSKREEAEAAIKAPDAIMGNRFIKLWWANRDRILYDGISSGNTISVSEGKDKVPVHSTPKVNINKSSDVQVAATDLAKPLVTIDPIVPLPLQKKLGNLELLKEELRRKQEMLDQKRTDFMRQLQKLEKQTSGQKSEEVTQQDVKRHKSKIIADDVKSITSRPSNSGTAVASPRAERVNDKNKSCENVVPHSSSTSTAIGLQEPTSMNWPSRPLAPVLTPSVNRFKLDNRPTTFRIMPPLPAGLANVVNLKEHFLSYGDLSNVELEDIETHEDSNGPKASKNCSARVSFASRLSAEKAFKSGKCWEDHNLQFMWVKSINSSNSNDGGTKENSLPPPNEPIDDNPRPMENLASNVSPVKMITNKSCGDPVEPDKNIQSISTKIQCEKESPKDDASRGLT